MAKARGRSGARQNLSSRQANADIVCKVLATAEYLRLCADHLEPDGEGVPLDIVVLPDFVVDVDGAAVEMLNRSDEPGGRFAAAEVGSRAGRVLSILAHLRDRDDDHLRLHYIAKTGALGRSVLQERLQRNLERSGLEPVLFRYLAPCRHTRVAVLGRPRYGAVTRQIVKSTDDNLLKVEELCRHIHRPAQILRSARAIYFATDTLKQFQELVHGTVVGLGSAPPPHPPANRSKADVGFRNVFVDLASIHAPDEAVAQGRAAELLMETIDHWKKCAAAGDDLARRTLLTVIVPSELPFGGSIDLRSIHQRLGLREGQDLIVALPSNPADGRNEVESHDGKSAVTVPVRIDSDRPDAREALIAGLVLYQSVASAWSAIPRQDRLKYRLEVDPDLTGHLLPDPYSTSEPFWTNIDYELERMRSKWPASEALQFGAAVAGVWEAEPSSAVPDRRALAASVLRGEALDRVPPGDDLLSWYKNLLLAESDLANNHMERHRDFIQTVVAFVKTGSDYLCHPLSWPDSRARVVQVASRAALQTLLALRFLRYLARSDARFVPLFERRYAYLTDLDGTLLKSSALRSQCLRGAMLELLSCRSASETIDDTYPILPDRANLCGTIGPCPYSATLPVGRSLLEILESCDTLYDAYIYSQWEFWKKTLETYPYDGDRANPKDFRQVWGHRLSYAVFIWVLHRLSGQLEIPDCPAQILLPALDLQSIKKLLALSRKDRKDQCKRNLEKWLSESGEPERFFKAVANIETKFRRFIDATARRSWETRFEPFRSTTETLRTLHDVLGVRTYVGTEGHHETQLRKITSLGLGHLFPEMAVMSTEAAASTHEDLRNIRDEIRKFDNMLQTYDLYIRQGNVPPTQFKNDAAKWQRIKECLSFYEGQWERLSRKEEGTIFALMVASILVEANVPFVALTDLWHLVERTEKAANRIVETHFAMLGDRELKDIDPVIRGCSNHFCKTDVERITTVRLLTSDHKDEGLYWELGGDPEKDPRRAHYVAWTPSQALLCLAREQYWLDLPLSYGTIPSFLPGYLFDPDTGNINEDVLAALLWESEKPDHALGRALALIRFLIVRNTIRQAEDGNCSFLRAAIQRLSASRETADTLAWQTYSFMITVVKHVAMEAPYMPHERGSRAASLVREVICEEARHHFGGYDNPGRTAVPDLILKSLDGLVYGANGTPLCAAPDPRHVRWLYESVGALKRDPEAIGQLTRLLEFWERAWPNGAAVPPPMAGMAPTS